MAAGLGRIDVCEADFELLLAVRQQRERVAVRNGDFAALIVP